jgi:hypothetical protein
MQLTDWLLIEVALLLIGLTKISFVKNWFFLLAMYSQSPLQLCLEILFLQTHATSYVSVKEKRKKPDRKPYHLPYGLRNPHRNLKTETSQDYAQKPNKIVHSMNTASGYRHDFPHF